MEKQQISNEENDVKEKEDEKVEEENDQNKEKDYRSTDPSVCFTDRQYLYILTREQYTENKEVKKKIVIDVYDPEQEW